MLRAAYMREPVKRSHVELHDALFSKPSPGRTTPVDALFAFTKNHRQALEQLTSPIARCGERDMTQDRRAFLKHSAAALSAASLGADDVLAATPHPERSTPPCSVP
jgi:hypothetical protein